MEKRISENLIWKIGSILAAFIIWCAIMNIVKPLVEERVSVPIQLIVANDDTGENATYNTKDNITTVRVNYRIRSDYIGKINSNDFEAIINIPNGFTNGFLPIKINYLNNVKNYIASSNFYPTTALITKDEIRTEIIFITNLKNFFITAHPADFYTVILSSIIFSVNYRIAHPVY